MEYVEKCKCPPELEVYKNKYTNGWVERYRKNTTHKTPSDNYWTEDSIRNPLIQSFKNNCGYCGREIARYQDLKPAGQVDHFLPKSKFPESVYEWSNYIWCCKDCNTKKKEYDGFLNPCELLDMDALDFDGASGRYYIKPKFKNKEIVGKFEQTQKFTLFNSSIISKEKISVYNDIQDCIDKLLKYLPKINSSIDVEYKEHLIEDLNKAVNILYEALDDNDKSYFFLKKRIVKDICRKLLNKKAATILKELPLVLKTDKALDVVSKIVEL